MKRKGELLGEGITGILIWILFFIAVSIGIYFIIQRLFG